MSTWVYRLRQMRLEDLHDVVPLGLAEGRGKFQSWGNWGRWSWASNTDKPGDGVLQLVMLKSENIVRNASCAVILLWMFFVMHWMMTSATCRGSLEFNDAIADTTCSSLLRLTFQNQWFILCRFAEALREGLTDRYIAWVKTRNAKQHEFAVNLKSDSRNWCVR